MSQMGVKQRGLALCMTYHLPNISGLTLSAHRLAQHVAGLGYKVTIITGRFPRNLASRQSTEGIEIIRSWAPFRLGKALVMPLYWRDLWRGFDDIELVNVHLPCADAATVAIVAKLRGRRLILSYAASMTTATWADRMVRAVASVPHLVAGVLADRIQVVSKDYAEASQFCRLFGSKLRFAPPPVFLGLFEGELCPARPAERLSDPRPIRLGYVGRIARQKSLGVLLDALPVMVSALGRPVILDIAGPALGVIGERYWRDILDRIKASGGTVRHMGVLHGRELAEFYAGLDLLVLPSMDRQESFGLVQIEAMLRRVPVIASDLPGMRQPVTMTGMGRLFAPGNASALAEAAIDLLRHGPSQDVGADTLDKLFGDAVTAAPYLEILQETS